MSQLNQLTNMIQNGCQINETEEIERGHSIGFLWYGAFHKTIKTIVST